MTVAKHQVDEIDLAILNCIRDKARMSHAEVRRALAERLQQPIELSESTISRRMRALEMAGIIVKYVTVLDHQSVGATFEAYVELTVKSDVDLDQAIFDLLAMTEVREASLVTGDADIMLRIRTGDREELRAFVRKLRGTQMIQRSKTLIAIDRVRRSPARGLRRVDSRVREDTTELAVDDLVAEGSH